MKKMVVILLTLVVSPALFAQEETNTDWQIMPSVSLTMFLEGKAIHHESGVYLPTFPPMMSEYGTHTYAGTGLNFTARCFSEDIKPLALTFGAGATWYYRPGGEAIAAPAAGSQGAGEMIGPHDFMTFPISLGVQAVFPYATRDKLMGFAGVEGNLQLISGGLAMNEQAKAGYTILGGVAVKFFEFGVRYTSFSDIKNLGAYFGLRFKSFGI
jgi:hypothetical protein